MLRLNPEEVIHFAKSGNEMVGIVEITNIVQSNVTYKVRAYYIKLNTFLYSPLYLFLDQNHISGKVSSTTQHWCPGTGRQYQHQRGASAGHKHDGIAQQR